MHFNDPWVLILIPVFIVLSFFVRKGYRERGFNFPTDEIIREFPVGPKLWLAKKRIYLRFFAVLLLLTALSRPQITDTATLKKEGIALTLAVDCSSTMLAESMSPGLGGFGISSPKKDSNTVKRIEAVKEIGKDFVKKRDSDMIGVVAFAAQAFLVSPLTFDHKWVLESLDRLKVGLIKDGTAIGSAILTSLKSLKDTEARSKVIVLLTDGINNFGQVPPVIASKAARAMGVKIYTIGVIGRERGLYKAEDGSGRKVFRGARIEVDEEELKEIARLTGGQYFRASDINSLKESYDTINRLEKSSIEQAGYEEQIDIFWYFVTAALLLLILDIVLWNTLFKAIP